jgi:hypothetical protein
VTTCKEETSGLALLRSSRAHPARFADHVLIPGRIPDELDICFIHAVDRENFALRIMRDRRTHSATRRSESHLPIEFQAAFRPLCQLTIGSQTEINQLHRNLGVETLPQLFQTAFGSGPSGPTGKKCRFLRGSSASQLDER